MLENITVIDFETTGFNPEWDFVTEIAAVRLRGGGIITSRFETLVNFGGVVPQNITDLTGITTEACAAGKEPRLAFALLRNFIGTDTIVAHNAAFDLAFLNKSYDRYGSTKPLENPFLCTALLAGQYIVGEHGAKDAKLSTLCEYWKIERGSAHRAMSDVLDTVQVLSHLFVEAEGAHEGWADAAEPHIREQLINRYPAPYVPGRQPMSNRFLPAHAQAFQREEVTRG